MKVDMTQLRRNKRRSHRAERARFDKTVFRLPAPFYRSPNGKIVVSMTAAEPIVLVVLSKQLMQPMILPGWLVKRPAALVGYWISGASSAWLDQLDSRPLLEAEEGITWARGQDAEAVASLRAVVAME